MKNKRKKIIIENYRPVNILNVMSQVYESCMHNSVSSSTETILSKFTLAYKKSCSSNHALLRFIENWIKSPDNNNFVGTVLLDFSMGFDCIPHNLIATKFHAYGLSENAVTLGIHT